MQDDDRDALAAEYVLGTLSADERDQAEALQLIDPGFAETVRLWERRLGELNVMVEAVEPPTELWERIKTEIDGAERRIVAETEAAPPVVEGDIAPATSDAPALAATKAAAEMAPDAGGEIAPDLLSEPAQSPDASPPEHPEDEEDTAAVAALASSLLPPQPEAKAETPPVPLPPAEPLSAGKIGPGADVISLGRRVRRWRGFTAVMTAIAALLAIYIAVGQFAPQLLPMRHKETHTAAAVPPPEARLVAVLQQDPTEPAFLLTVDPQHRTMTVRRMTATADSGRSYELWLIPGRNSKPQSLGIVGATEYTSRPLPENFDVATLQAARYAVSLEPAGGSPSGAPTGPVLFTGKMVQSVPGAAPSKS